LEKQELKEGATLMIERFKTYFQTLEGLSTEELDRSAEKLVRAEKRNVVLVIAHIAEMSRRKGQLESGYKNLFE
jgi:serine phosphatase RsbU (regulator of sigma subunit)